MKKHLFIVISTILCLSNGVRGEIFSIAESRFRSDSLTLFADIYTPHQTAKKVGIAFIQGSGNSDRANLWTQAFAKILVEHGYCVLVPDKRGCGKSEGSWKNASFLDLSTDATASAHHLKTSMRLDRVGLMGLSQGGFIAPIAASKDTTIDFVIDIVGAAVSLEEQITHEVMNSAIKADLKPNEIKAVLDLHVLMKQYAFDRNWPPLEKRFADLETSSWSDFAMTFPHSQDLWVWDWIKLSIDFDPMDYWVHVDQPVFVAYGAKDQYDNMPVYESIFRLQQGFHSMGKENYEIEVYDTGHAMYEDDKAMIRKEFVDDLLKWLDKR